MAFSGGTCRGTAGTFTHQGALAQAANQAASTGLGWRLPKEREIVNLVDRKSSNPAIDSTVFPSTPQSWFWSGTTYAEDPSVARDSGGDRHDMAGLAAGMNQGLGGSDSSAVWFVDFNGKGGTGVRAGDGGLNEPGYLRLVRWALPAYASAESLLDASMRGDEATVQTLLSKGTDVNTRAGYGSTALMYASRNGHLEIVQALLAKGADVNARSNTGTTALILASGKGYVDVVRALLAKGAETNATLDDGVTALILASQRGDLEVVGALLAADAEVNARTSGAGTNALIQASSHGHDDVVRALLARGADVNAKLDDGTTALILASLNGHIEVVQTLLAKGAKVNERTDNGVTALNAASARGYAEIKRALRQAGAKP
jgi:ankyrin repeat protein